MERPVGDEARELHWICSREQRARAPRPGHAELDLDLDRLGVEARLSFEPRPWMDVRSGRGQPSAT
jgi:hypothetical protein